MGKPSPLTRLSLLRGLKFSMVTNDYLWNIHILNPPPKKMEVDGSDDFPLEEMGDFEVPALNFSGV